MRIDIKGVIGQDVFANTIEDQLMNRTEEEVKVYIDSTGGEVFEGYKIGHTIRQYAPNAIAMIEGNCASIATFIACSCKERLINENNNSQYPFMIHNPKPVGFEGDSIAMMEVIDELQRIEGELKLAYTHVSSLKEKELTEMMSNETTFTAEEAISVGFVDGVYSEDAVSESIQNSVLSYVNISNMDKPEEKGNSLAKVMERIEALAANVGVIKKKFVNYTDTTLGGDQIFIDAESPAEAVGAEVYTIEEGESTDTPVSDGSYEMESGVIINVANGIIESIEEIDLEAKAKDSEIEDLKAQLAQKDEQLNAITAKVEEFEKNYQALEASLEEAKNKTVKGEEVKAPAMVNDITEVKKAKGDAVVVGNSTIKGIKFK